MDDRPRETQWLVGHDPPKQIGLFDLVQQFSHAIVEMAMYGAVSLLALQEFESQLFKLV